MAHLVPQHSPKRPYGYMKQPAQPPKGGLLGNPVWIWLPMFSFLPGVVMIVMMPLCADWRYFSGVAAIFAGTLVLGVFARIAYGRRTKGSASHATPFVLGMIACGLCVLGLFVTVAEIARSIP